MTVATATACAVGMVIACGCAAASAEAARPPSVKQAASPRAVSVFPLPGTPTASPKTEISFRGLPQRQLGRVRVIGSVSGRHAGIFVPHADGAGASFIPVRPFAPGEHVKVITHLHLRDARNGIYTFTVARPVQEPLTPPPSPPVPATPIETFRSEPDLHIAQVAVLDGSAADAAPGLIFIGPRRGAADGGVEIFDNAGEPVWFHKIPSELQATDFREQTWKGKPVLTWWQGRLGPGYGTGEGEIVDDAYRQVGTVHAGNGYQEDLHELELTSANTALITAYQPVRWNLSPVGGPTDGVVLDCIVQEVEVDTGRVLFEWHSLGNVPLADSYATPPSDPSQPFDYFHVNSVTTDDAGDVLVSSRATHTVYEVDGLTGRLHWRLGGKHSDFAMGSGTSFHSQHDVKWIDASTLTVFDNGAGVGGGNHTMTRALVLHVDRAARSVTLLSAFAQPQGQLFASQGDVQLLPNGDYFVGWGAGPYATEFAPDGHVVLDLELTSGSSYRAYRFDWHARPAAPPNVATASDGAGGTTVDVSWNGATDVASWRVLAGSAPGSLTPVETVADHGFETAADVPGAAAYVEVQALDAAGDELTSSQPVAVTR